LVEAGAHSGELAKDILGWLQRLRPDLFAQVEYWIIEPSPRRREWQQSKLAAFADSVRWAPDFSHLAPGVRGIIFANELLDAMPVAYAVTYIFGTVGSAIVLALIGPALLGIDLEAACKRYEEKHGGKKEAGGPGTAWYQFGLRAFRVKERGPVVGKTPQEAESLIPDQRVFVQAIRRDGKILDATADTVIHAGDVLAVAGRREVLVSLVGAGADEVNDRELLAVPIEGVDVYVTNKDVDGKTLAQLANLPGARGVFLRRIVRGATATNIPILADTQLQRGDVVTLVGRTQDVAAGTKMLGHPDRATDVADVAFIGGAITIGALLGALTYKVGSVPLTLSTSGGVLIAGLFFGWLRSVRPTFGRIPSPTVWFMNSVGLNVFIAVVGISSGPSFVAGLQQLGFSLFLWGVAVTTVPLILAMYVGKYLFKFDDAIVLGVRQQTSEMREVFANELSLLVDEHHLARFEHQRGFGVMVEAT
jgi:putative transport protein